MRDYKQFLRDPWRIVRYLGAKGYLRWIPDEAYLRLIFRARMGTKLDLENPKTFNEKVQWLKIHDRNPLYTDLVDKYKVRDYVSRKIGSEYLIPLLGVWDRPDDIPFDELPERFVLKCNHDSGTVVICKDDARLNHEKTKSYLMKQMNRNFYWGGREWPYKNVSPKIIAEPYLEDNYHQLIDYKIMCFNGEAKCCFIFSDRYSNSNMKLNVYDRNWAPLHVGREYTTFNPYIQKPNNYLLMLQLAEVMAENIPFVRIDFYEIKGKVYFGEITFFPNSGFTRFKPNEWDAIFGDWIALPTVNI